MKQYHQLTLEERSVIAYLRTRGYSQSAIARHLNRHRSTISREVSRNRCNWDGAYRALRAERHARVRRKASRFKSHYHPSDYYLVRSLLYKEWSPEQISGHLRRHNLVRISYETIYKWVWWDKRWGGSLYKHLRHGLKVRRKQYGSYDRRGRMTDKRMIDERPQVVESRATKGHWEVDTVVGRRGTKACLVTLVERKTGHVLIGHSRDRSVSQVNRTLLRLLRRHPGKFKTITADNGTEFHGYKSIEEKMGVQFYFAQPYHSWERGSNEHVNGLIRQYVPKASSLDGLTQHKCDWIAQRLNSRPRKRHNYRTPAECFHGRCRTPWSHLDSAA